MNNTLIIYDNNGIIFFQASGTISTPVGLQHMFIEIPSDKNLTGIDISVTPHLPIFADIPKDPTVARLEAVEAVLEEMIMGGM